MITQIFNHQPWEHTCSGKAKYPKYKYDQRARKLENERSGTWVVKKKSELEERNIQRIERREIIKTKEKEVLPTSEE